MNRLRAVILIKKQPVDRRINIGGLGLSAELVFCKARRAQRFVAGSRRTSADDLG